ncbi:hypothetical protein KL86DPRO_11893 [uncultured delta proteobacterium]|uniref:Uncharacterized protein n=1 Tax=uncultured delta proteobacterium TaxID=34034 RepID=A0A212JNT8_9DELT|nr:hypothetical protein KL86DPRO_11893 [uncultured delta proteobacterium]
MTAWAVACTDYRAHKCRHGLNVIRFYLEVTRAKKVRIDSLTAIAAKGRAFISSLCLRSSDSHVSRTLLITSRQIFSNSILSLSMPKLHLEFSTCRNYAVHMKKTTCTTQVVVNTTS